MATKAEQSAQTYIQLVQNGTPPAEAFKQAYPNGIPTASEQAALKAKQAQSGQLLGLGGTVGGLVGGKALVDAVGGTGWFAEKAAEEGAKQLASQAVQQEAANQVGQATIQSAARTGASQLAPTGAEAATPGLLSGWGGLGFGPQAGIVAGTALTAKGLYDLSQNKKGDPLSRGVTAMSTFGYSELGRALGLGGHVSTRDTAKKHTKDLLNTGKDDANWQGYVQGMREQHNSAPPDPSKPFAGKYSSWDEYKKAGLEANDLTGVYGNLKTFGPEWANLGQDQRVAVTQGLINAGLYDSKKGEVIVKDEGQAKAIKNQVLGGGTTPTQTATTTAASSQPVVTANPKLALALNKQNNAAASDLAKSIYFRR